MTALQTALIFARQIDAAAAVDAARQWPRHEELYARIGDLAGGLGYDAKTRVEQTLADILPAWCEQAAQQVADDNPNEWSVGRGGNDPDAGMSGWLEDEMERAHAEAATNWLAEARKLAGPMLVTVPKMMVAA